MKVALCFFGITRSLKYTHNSIKEKIFNIFIKNKIDYDIFMHTYELNTYRNIRTNEKSNNINNEEYKLIEPKYLLIDNQDEIKKELCLNKYRTHPDPWKTSYNSVDNFILAQYSKYRILELLEQNKENNYDYILFIRPDCKYLTNFNIEWLKHVNDKTVIIPNFALYIAPYIFNDRFIITTYNVCRIYASLFEKLLDISKKRKLHSESVIWQYLTDNNIKIARVNFIFQRVRLNGSIPDHDRNLHKQKKNIYNKQLQLLFT